MQFRLYPLRFGFRARDSIHFPVPAANLLRGALGKVLHDASRESYSRLFAPAGVEGPSGLADRPRPFVFRARHLDGAVVAAGSSFFFDLNLFDMRGGAPADMEAALGRLPGMELTGMAAPSGGNPRQPLAIDLAPGTEPVRRLQVSFLSPTELKAEARVVERPEFAILAARIRDRISTLRALYDEGPLALDFRAFAERAALVRTARSDLRFVERERRSGRTGRFHPLGGFAGEVEYEGELGEFLPYLEAACWTGVGRQTVWGKGEIAISY